MTGFSFFLSTIGQIAVAFVLGTLIGAERQWRQRSAGLRTIVLVVIGAAAFANLGTRLAGPEGAVRIVAYIVSGIGFLGAGVILKDGGNVLGLNTAGTLWCSAAVGAISGCGYLAEAAGLTGFVLAANTLLRPLVNYISRLPISARGTEAQYTVHVLCDPEHVSEVRNLLFVSLGEAQYPISDVETISDSDEFVELGAVLVPTTAVRSELDAVVAALKHSDLVKSATWTTSTTT